ncbi:hypothetical protein [Marilutibacter aestuarii]|uniref:Uncharacterized protein n=1 Tax=Marilutibacter aestuarii TaxID=1706195 RepID=A0A507ZZE8_9GAMM|nr:hypothetical protein [Lysobacter aestuarii]TQD42367.1 hypothetical protein FKV25_11830 [Lysobacter aestuarii]
MGLYDRMMQGVQMAEAGKVAGQKSKLQSLLGQAVADPNARRQALGQAAMIDAPTSLAVQEKLQGLDMAAISQGARMLVAAPEQLRPQIYREKLAPLGKSLGVQGEYTPFLYPMMEKLAQAGGGSDVPATQRHQQWLLSQLSEEDRPEALKYFAGLGSRPLQESFSSEVVQTSNGPMVLQRGRLGENRLAPFQTGGSGGGGMAPGAGQAMVDETTTLATQMAQAGISDAQIEAFIRSRLNAGGIDTQPPMQRMGAQPMPAAGSPITGPRLDPVNGGYMGGARPLSAAEEAAQKRLAETNVDLSTADARARAEAEAQRLKTAAQKDAELEAERNEQAPKRVARYQQALDTAQNVQSSIQKARNMIGGMSTGFIGARSRGIEGSPAYNLAAEIETIKANLGFDRLQQMRDNSPTGGALGQVAIQELTALQSTVANLDPNQSAEQLQRNLDRIADHYSKWSEAVRDALREEGAGGNASKAPQAGSVQDGYRFKGGNPADKNNWERL